MDRVTGKLTVFFEKPFGVGGFERTEAGRLSACRVTFDAEPKEYEVRAFVLENYYKLTFSPSVEVGLKSKSTDRERLNRSGNANSDNRNENRNTGAGNASVFQIIRKYRSILEKECRNMYYIMSHSFVEYRI